MTRPTHDSHMDEAVVSPKGAARWRRGHPWIFKSDVTRRPHAAAGAVRVRDARGKALGVALWSPTSEISLRLVDASPDATLDAPWWHARIATAIARRARVRDQASAYRVI